MVVGLLTLEVHLPYAHSLKEKRQVVRRLKDRLRSHFNVAIAEVGHQELWQRATVGVVTISSDRAHLVKQLESVAGEADRLLESDLVRTEIEIF